MAAPTSLPHDAVVIASPLLQRGVLLEGGGMSDDVQPLDSDGGEPAPEPAAQAEVAEEAGGGEATESPGTMESPTSPGGGCDSFLR
eukprot:COSAG02_NODE_26621_length_629_cov_0.747170_1_plen_86_part_00